MYLDLSLVIIGLKLLPKGSGNLKINQYSAGTLLLFSKSNFRFKIAIKRFAN